MLEDYEIICPLNYNTNQTINSYKARHKLTEESVILHSIDLTKYTNIDTILNRVNERKSVKTHPNLLKFLTVFEDKPFKILYIVTEYCYNGNLNTVINNCTKEKRYLSEELICRLFYQLLCAIKTIPIEKFTGKLSIDEIFIDEDFNIKLLNLQVDFDKNQKMSDLKMYKLARIIYNLTTLRKFDKSVQNNEIKKVQYYYSSEFINLLITLLKDHCLLYKNLDKILCNSTILLKSSQWIKDRSFFIVAQNSNEDYLQKSKLLKEKEMELYYKEKQLKEKERNLDLREKRLNLIEKQINDKLLMLDHYTNNKSNPTPWNDIDTSFSADCDSIIVTGAKLDSNIVKPAAFTRSKSERRVKFKGHSPLKKMNYSKRTIKKLPKSDDIKEDKSSNFSSSSSSNSKLSKKLFDEEKNSRPISWNEDSKRQAFDLLRMMNNANKFDDIKHTYL